LVSLLFLLALAVIFLSPLMSCYFFLSLIYSFFLSY
jgi:hypothetical protein